jgi:predicted 3-demethylubiquinone-9 3-methyltransferase (glyoxalase superfamily)
MQKITPFLWFEGNAEQAAQFYVSIFKNSKIINASPMSVTLELEGQRLMILNGGPHYKLSPAVSLFVNCETQLEIDDLWVKLTADGGADGRCGWLVDKYGLSWQLVPPILGQLLGDKDRMRAQRVMAAMMKMNKLEIAVLEQAALEP